MQAEEAGVSNNFGLPEEVLEVLPSDPFEQLDVARKITSIALTTRVSALESEASSLRAQLADRDYIVADLQSQIESLDASLADTTDKLALANQQKEALLNENSILSDTVKKLRKDVSKLEVFRKTLMQSLQVDEDIPTGVHEAVAKDLPTRMSSSSQPLGGGDDVTLPPPLYSSTQSHVSEPGYSFSEDRETDAARPRISPGLLLASQTSTPRFTPPGSPPVVASSVSPSKTSKPTSPRRHSISFSTTRGMFDASSLPSSNHSSFSSYDAASQGRTRVDGKEFFRQVRSRLSYEQFGAFLANVKDLNSHKQSKEETLKKAEEIFGPDNKDLYSIFEGLLTRNIH
ncbi:hypothetical protein Nepgr_010184 [Nepenthes gracilis]|uniref:At4g15545-like C-terminal domain-containing protein n=1 Tax=Nepenthes gracilis TaxID=150966 RepID=A0AAD3SCW5_NEPGR|nr:hypothetical protein Nepgr_010184 [Nepenthes gracilis]